MEMTFFQAILIGCIYWLYASGLPFGDVFSTAFFYYPLVASFWVGVILGNIPTAMMCGAAVQAIYLYFDSAGGNVPSDKCAATLISTSVVILSGSDPSTAVALSVPLALLAAQLHTIRRIFGIVYVRMTEKLIERGNTNPNNYLFVGSIIPSLVKVILFWIPATLAVYFGSNAISSVIENIPVWLSNGLNVAGNMVPAIGMALTIKVIGNNKYLPFFLAGFFLVQYFAFGSILMVLIGAFLAFIVIIANDKDTDDQEDDIFSIEDKKDKRILSKKDVRNTALYWFWNCVHADNVERAFAVNFAQSLSPALKKIYKNDDQGFLEAMTRHQQYYNTECAWGGLITGAILSLEEQKGLGEDISEDLINNTKIGLMGPLAAIGDTIDWGTLAPLSLAFCIPFAAEGSWWGGILAGCIIFGVMLAENLYFTYLGYNMGSKAAISMLESGKVQKILKFFAMFGLFMIGNISAGAVSVNTGIIININDIARSLQVDILDTIFPGMLSLVTIFITYFYLEKSKSKNAIIKGTLGLLIIGLILGGLGILV